MPIHRKKITVAVAGLKRCRRADGNAVVEFALVLPLLLGVLFGITEFGRAIATIEVLSAAAREGARIAAVTAPDQNAVENRVNQVCESASITPSSITVVGPVGSPESTVQVTVQSDFEVLAPAGVGASVLPFGGTITLQGVSVMRHEG